MKQIYNGNISFLNLIIHFNSCILYYDTDKFHVLRAYGCFSNFWSPCNTDDNKWNMIKKIEIKDLLEVSIPIYNANQLSEIYHKKFIPFEEGTFFNPYLFLNSKFNLKEISLLPLDSIYRFFLANNQNVIFFNWFSENVIKHIFSSEENISKLDDNFNMNVLCSIWELYTIMLETLPNYFNYRKIYLDKETKKAKMKDIVNDSKFSLAICNTFGMNVKMLYYKNVKFHK